MLVLYENIRRRREELGISQEELANMLGYKSRSSINKIEKGINDIPQSKIVEFAKALRTTPEELMGWKVPNDQPRIDEARLLRDEREVEHMRKYRALSEEQRAAIDNQLDFYFARIEVEITVPDERAELHRQLDEALAREKKGARVSSSGRSATGTK